MKKIGIVGCGSIGTEIAVSIDKKIINAELVALYDLVAEKANGLSSRLKSSRPSLTVNLKELVDSCDFVVETASQKAVGEIAKLALPSGKDMFAVSIGGLINNPWIFKSAKENKCNVYYPSGAVAGLDGIRAARMGKIKSVTLTTSKPYSTLKNVLFVKESGIFRNGCGKPTVVFDGTARKAIKCFPQNINVAATISLAGIGPDKTKVKIIAVPDKELSRNVHEIRVSGNFGEIYIKTENVPSESNPKTSYLATLSSVSMLKDLCNK